MASKDLADAKEHIASIGDILERAIVAQTLDSITELKVDPAEGDPAGGSSSSSTQMSPSTVSMTTAPAQLITERPLGLQELHNELGAIGHAATHTQTHTHTHTHTRARARTLYSTHTTTRATHADVPPGLSSPLPFRKVHGRTLERARCGLCGALLRLALTLLSHARLSGTPQWQPCS